MPEKDFLKLLGKRIKVLRLQKHLTQLDLAVLCNFEKATMSRIESGKSNITILTLRKISKALEISMVEFF